MTESSNAYLVGRSDAIRGYHQTHVDRERFTTGEQLLYLDGYAQGARMHAASRRAGVSLIGWDGNLKEDLISLLGTVYGNPKNSQGDILDNVKTIFEDHLGLKSLAYWVSEGRQDSLSGGKFISLSQDERPDEQRAYLEGFNRAQREQGFAEFSSLNTLFYHKSRLDAGESPAILDATTAVKGGIKFRSNPNLGSWTVNSMQNQDRCVGCNHSHLHSEFVRYNACPAFNCGCPVYKQWIGEKAGEDVHIQVTNPVSLSSADIYRETAAQLAADKHSLPPTVETVSATTFDPPLILPEGEVRTTSSTGGMKGVKPERYSLLPPESLDSVARLYAFGAKKYAAHNWRLGYEWTKSYDSLFRHATASLRGEDIDEETGEPHLAGVVFHAFTLMAFLFDYEQYGQHDDRWKGRPEEKSPDDVLEGSAEETEAVRTENIASIEEDLRDAAVAAMTSYAGYTGFPPLEVFAKLFTDNEILTQKEAEEKWRELFFSKVDPIKMFGGPVEPLFPACERRNGSMFITIPETTGIEYYVNGVLSKAGRKRYRRVVEITPRARPGYHIPRDSYLEWRFEP